MKTFIKTHSLILSLFLLCTAQIIFAAPVTIQNSNDSTSEIEGVWEGTLDAAGAKVRLVLHIVSKGDGTLKALMDSPDQGIKDIQVDDIELKKDRLHFKVNMVGGKYKGLLDAEGKTLDGTWSQGGDFNLVFKKDPTQKPREIKEYTVADVDPAIYKSYTGRYEIQPGFVLSVSTKDNKLFVQATGQPEIEVFPESETKFFYKVVNAQLTFVKDEDGAVNKLILHQNGRDMPAPKLADK
jgi:hypothetical protein